MDYAQSHGTWNVDYPLVQLFALLGFFLVYFVEEIRFVTTWLFGFSKKCSLSSVAAFGAHSHGHDQTLVTQNPSIFNVDRVAPTEENKNGTSRRQSASNW